MASRDQRFNSAYESNDGFSPLIWGPLMWLFLHIMSFNYPVYPTKEDMIKYCQFIISLGDVLPCGTCRANYPENLKAVKFSPRRHLQSRHHLSRFIYKLHEEVSRRTGSGPLPYTYCELRELCESFRAKCVPVKSVERGCNRPKEYVKSCSRINILPVDDCKGTESLHVSSKIYQRIRPKRY
jgi:hypothetical protein